MKIKSLVATVAVAGMAVGLSGCYPGHYHNGRHGGGVVDPTPGLCAVATCFGLTAMGASPEVAVAGAVIAGAIVLDQHDGHWHGRRCGCQSRWHQGYQVYWYNGHWEYYDNGRWYGYQDNNEYDRGPRW